MDVLQNMRDLFVNEPKKTFEGTFSEEVELLAEESNQDVEVLQTEQLMEFESILECPGCTNLKAKIVKLQKRVSYLKKIRRQLYSRIEEVCNHKRKLIVNCKLE